MHQVLHIRRAPVKQLDTAVDVLAQTRPVQIEKWVVPRNLPDHVVGNTRSPAQPRQVKLLDFASATHIVYQEVGVAFASNKSHDYLLFLLERFVVYGTSTTPSMVRCCP